MLLVFLFLTLNFLLEMFFSHSVSMFAMFPLFFFFSFPFLQHFSLNTQFSPQTSLLKLFLPPFPTSLPPSHTSNFFFFSSSVPFLLPPSLPKPPVPFLLPLPAAPSSVCSLLLTSPTSPLTPLPPWCSWWGPSISPDMQRHWFCKGRDLSQ